MKSDLLKGIVLISAVALSSCSVTNKMAGTRNTGDDDVYHTQAQAGDRIEYADANNYQQNANDDYYYYGDYASRINRFTYNSPFAYDDDFYYSYVPYNNGFGLDDNLDQSYYYGNSKADTLATRSAMYAPFDDGYLPYFDMGGYDDIGYGDLYSAYLFGGGGWGGGWGFSRHHTHSGYSGSSSSHAGTSGSPLTFRRGAPNSSNGQIYYPGRPIAATSGRNTNVTSYQNNQRAVRTETQNVRPAVQQTFSNTPAQSSAPASSSGASSSGSSSSGGGGRPVR